MRLSLLYYGNPLLRKISSPLKEVTEETRSFVKDMIETMEAYDGAGLAAPQVGKLVRIFVINIVGDNEEGLPILGESTVFINPEIEALSKETHFLTEGCLSIPHLRKPVERSLELTVHALDLHGNRFTEKVTGWRARVILHEYDHLEGILFIDRLSNSARKEVTPYLKKLKETR